jgi:DNA polymerase V
MLERYGVRTAGDFVRKDPLWVKKKLSVRGAITQLELRGHSLDGIGAAPRPPRSIQISRSFGEDLATLDELEKPIVEHAAGAGRRLREEGLAAGCVTVYIRSGHAGGEHKYLSKSTSLDTAVSSDHELIREALSSLRAIYVKGGRYTKAGVELSRLANSGFRQRTLFDEPGETASARFESFARAADLINKKLGKSAIYPAALACLDKKWRAKGEHLSSYEFADGYVVVQ